MKHLSIHPYCLLAHAKNKIRESQKARGISRTLRSGRRKSLGSRSAAKRAKCGVCAGGAKHLKSTERALWRHECAHRGLILHWWKFEVCSASRSCERSGKGTRLGFSLVSGMGEENGVQQEDLGALPDGPGTRPARVRKRDILARGLSPKTWFTRTSSSQGIQLDEIEQATSGRGGPDAATTNQQVQMMKTESMRSMGSTGSVTVASTSEEEMRSRAQSTATTTGGVLSMELPAVDRFEMLVDPIPLSDRGSVHALSQTWRNMKAGKNPNEPGMQILYASLPVLVRFLCGSKGMGHWDAFLNTLMQHSRVGDVLNELMCYIRGEDPMEVTGRANYLIMPSDDGIMAVISRQVQPLESNRNTDDADSEVTLDNEEGGGQSQEQQDHLEECFALPSFQVETLKRVLKELGLNAELEIMQRNAHAFLCFWMREGFASESFSDAEVQLANDLMTELEEDDHFEEGRPTGVSDDLGVGLAKARSESAQGSEAAPSDFRVSTSGLQINPGLQSVATHGSPGMPSSVLIASPPASPAQGSSSPQFSFPAVSQHGRENSSSSTVSVASAGSTSSKPKKRSSIKKGSKTPRGRSLSHGWKKKKFQDGSTDPIGENKNNPHGPKGDFGTFTPAAVAHFLTWQLYNDAYRLVEASDLMTKKARESSIPVQRMIELFDMYAYWPLTYVLKSDVDPLPRANRLLFFLEVAEHCRRLHNYHCFFGIVAGLSQPMMQWLWDFMQPKDRQRLEDLKRAVKSKGDYLVYRADLSKCSNKSHIPFLGLTTKLLYPLEHNVAATSLDQPHMINLSRCVSMQKTVDDFLRGQLNGYELDFSTLQTGALDFTIPTVDASKGGLNVSLSQRKKSSDEVLSPSQASAGSVSSISGTSSTRAESSTASVTLQSNGPAGVTLAADGSPNDAGSNASSLKGKLSKYSVGSSSARGFKARTAQVKSRGNSFGSSHSYVPAYSATRLTFDERVAATVDAGMRKTKSKEKLEKLSVSLRSRLAEDLRNSLETAGFY